MGLSLGNSVEVMWKRSAEGSNNNTVVNHYFHAPFGRNLTFYSKSENLVRTNKSLSAHGWEELRPEWADIYLSTNTTEIHVQPQQLNNLLISL